MTNSEAIEALRDLLDTTQEYPHLDGMTMFGDALNMAISALEKQEKDRWTPVAENTKKPQFQFDTYLVYTKYERFGVADFFADGSWIGYDIDGDQINGDEITAWRPLPKPPYQEDKA